MDDSTEPGFDEALGHAITLTRVERGLKRQQLANLAGVSIHTLRDIERGKRSASPEILALVSVVLGIEPARLLGDARRLLGTGTTRWEPALHSPDKPAPASSRSRPPEGLNEAWVRAIVRDEMRRAGLLQHGSAHVERG